MIEMAILIRKRMISHDEPSVIHGYLVLFLDSIILAPFQKKCMVHEGQVDFTQCKDGWLDLTETIPALFVFSSKTSKTIGQKKGLYKWADLVQYVRGTCRLVSQECRFRLFYSSGSQASKHHFVISLCSIDRDEPFRQPPTENWAVPGKNRLRWLNVRYNT